MIEPGTAHVWPSALTRVAAQRDRARSFAARVEAENAALIEFLIGTGGCTAPGAGAGLARCAETADEVLVYVHRVLATWRQP